jgi:hypothetical protein
MVSKNLGMDNVSKYLYEILLLLSFYETSQVTSICTTCQVMLVKV